MVFISCTKKQKQKKEKKILISFYLPERFGDSCKKHDLEPPIRHFKGFNKWRPYQPVLCTCSCTEENSSKVLKLQGICRSKGSKL